MPEFFLLTVFHWILGLLLTAYAWGCGAIALEKLGFLHSSVERSNQYLNVALAYPFGLAWTFVVATVITIPAFPGPLALALVLAPLFALWPARSEAVSTIRQYFFPVIVGSIAGIVASGVWHGATSQLPGRYMFDSAYYAGRVQTVLVNGPFGNELSLEGLRYYGRMLEQGPPHIGAAMATLPGFDPFLFYSGVCVTFFGGSIAIFLSRLQRTTGGGLTTVAVTSALLIGVAMALSTKYPSWLTESPPVAFALPLGLSALAILEREDLSVRRLALYGAVLIFTLYLSKVLGAVFFAALLTPHFVRTVGKQLGHRVAYFATAAVIAATLIALALNADIAATIPKPFTRGHWTFSDALSHWDLLLALLIVAAVMILPARYRISAALAGATFWILPSFINLSPGLLLQIVTVRGLMNVDDRKSRFFLIAIALLGAVSAYMAVRGRNADLLQFASLAIPFAVVYLLANRHVARHYPTIALTGVAGAFALSMAVARPSGSLNTPAKYRFWTEVRKTVPKDALVFTDQTGPDLISLAEGANYQSSLGERQLYIGGWAYLANDSIVRNRRLDTNRAVLAGALQPNVLNYSRPYSKYFAATSRDARVPSSFQRVFSNSEMSLYEIAIR